MLGIETCLFSKNVNKLARMTKSRFIQNPSN